MPQAHENGNTKQKIEELRNSIKALQNESRQASIDRNSLVQQQKAVRKQISTLISETQQLRKTRDELTSEVKAEKGKRTELNSQIKEKVTEIKTLSPSKKSERNAAQIKYEINRINKKIETECVSFEKEKQLMKVLHGLEKEYAAAMKEREAFAQKKKYQASLAT